MNQVCPDRQLLSVYFDGELPSPWKEKMEAHVQSCAFCAGRLETYRLISVKPPQKGLEAAQERVRQKLEAVLPEPASAGVAPSVWRRRLSVPLPAAAAVFVLVALAFLLLLREPWAHKTPGMLLAAENDFDTPGIIPASDMEDVLQYLGSRDNGELIILRLPESRSFVNYGEPAIIRAADYSRQQMPRGRRQ